MSDIASPPATGDWFDVDATASAVFQILRLQGGDVDAERIRLLVPGAANRIDVYCDRESVLLGPPPDPQVQHALEQLVLSRYLRAYPAQGGVYQIIDDDTQILDRLIPGERQRWGVA